QKAGEAGSSERLEDHPGEAPVVGVTALGACSGGMDGILAAALLAEQGVSVELVTFESPFFSPEGGRAAALELGAPWHCEDISEGMLELLRDPPSGFGKNLNPCIDCHALMFSRLGQLALRRGAAFIFTGEVLGQRPMSQNRGSLNRIARLSGYQDILLRPLSAKLLRPTRPEMEGLVDRERLLDLSGRGRKRQRELAARVGIAPRQAAGGCILTDPAYSSRLARLLERPGLLTVENCRLLQHGRVYDLPGGALGIVGRNRRDNLALLETAGPGHTVVELTGVPGPIGVLMGSPEDLTLLCSLVAYHAKVPPGTRAILATRDGTLVSAVPATERLNDDLMIRQTR
ncbi:hypothetical protein JW921_00270, partial [Candidatus Fermentibacterales bacterium]|nr:hypothetical protein [Candidatus Fermentibacterales bacterium]